MGMAGPAPTSTPPPTPVPPFGSPSPFPTALTTPAPSLHPPAIKARAAILEDLDTGQALYALHPDAPRPIASTTKIMTAILVVERTRPSDTVHMTREAFHYQGSGVGVLPHHKRMPIEGLMEGMLLPSGNEIGRAHV